MSLTKFARQFRWTLTPAGHDGAAWFCKKARLDLFRNRLEVHAYDAQVGGECPVTQWIVKGKHADITLRFYDQGGKVIDAIKLKGVKPVRHRLDVDQSSSKACIHQMLFSFQSVELA